MTQEVKLSTVCKECLCNRWIEIGPEYPEIYECANCGYPELIKNQSINDSLRITGIKFTKDKDIDKEE